MSFCAAGQQSVWFHLFLVPPLRRDLLSLSRDLVTRYPLLIWFSCANFFKVSLTTAVGGGLLQSRSTSNRPRTTNSRPSHVRERTSTNPADKRTERRKRYFNLGKGVARPPLINQTKNNKVQPTKGRLRRCLTAISFRHVRVRLEFAFTPIEREIKQK